MEFGFFFSYIEEVGEHAELGFYCYGTERAEQRGNIFGGVLGLHPRGEIVALLLIEVLGIAAMSQIYLASACVHDWVPRYGVGRVYLRLNATR